MLQEQFSLHHTFLFSFRDLKGQHTILRNQWERALSTARRSYFLQDHQLRQQRPKATHLNSQTYLLLQVTKLTSSLPWKHITEPPSKQTEADPQPATVEEKAMEQNSYGQDHPHLFRTNKIILRQSWIYFFPITLLWQVWMQLENSPSVFSYCKVESLRWNPC